MPTEPALAILVVRPGPLRSSLRALMATMPQIGILAECCQATALHQLNPQLAPNLVLIEAGLLANGVGQGLMDLRRRWPQSCLIILVDDPAQRQLAEAAGAHAVLYKGFRAARLMTLIETVLAQRAGAAANQNACAGHRRPDLPDAGNQAG